MNNMPEKMVVMILKVYLILSENNNDNNKIKTSNAKTRMTVFNVLKTNHFLLFEK